MSHRPTGATWHYQHNLQSQSALKQKLLEKIGHKVFYALNPQPYYGIDFQTQEAFVLCEYFTQEVNDKGETITKRWEVKEPYAEFPSDTFVGKLALIAG